jgi:ADP-ribose pyrophosphatase YjhB (NUDIX family)
MSVEIQEYVLAFIFDKTLENVHLIRKTKPEWQAGKLNGIGGKVEHGENIEDAIYREVKEETGMVLKKDDLKSFGNISEYFNNKLTFNVYLFAGVTDQTPKSLEFEEKGEYVETRNIYDHTDLLSSVPTLIFMAKQFIEGMKKGKVITINVNYSL